MKKNSIKIGNKKIGENSSITKSSYPNIINKYLIEEEHEYPIMINGKLRSKQKFSSEHSNSEIKKSVLENSKVIK